jgi:hypothetical protein
MGIFGLWLMWRIKDSVEQIREQTRRSQLTPAERAAEDRVRNEEETAEYRARQIMLIIFLAAILTIVFLARFVHSPLV